MTSQAHFFKLICFFFKGGGALVSHGPAFQGGGDVRSYAGGVIAIVARHDTVKGILERLLIMFDQKANAHGLSENRQAATGLSNCPPA